MSIRSGYESIRNPNEPEQETGSQVRGVDPEAEAGTPFFKRVKEFDYRSYYQQHSLSAIAIACILSFIFLLIGLATFLPVIKHKPAKIIFNPPLVPGISSISLQQGLMQCRALTPQHLLNTNKPRTVNPRAPKDLQTVLIKNAVVWDGQGNVLEDMDILLSHGIIQQVKQNIQVPDDNGLTKVIDVGGHIVSPGLVDMHT